MYRPLFLLFLGTLLTTRITAQVETPRMKRAALPWNMNELANPPKAYPAPEYQSNGVRSVFYEGPLWKG